MEASPRPPARPVNGTVVSAACTGTPCGNWSLTPQPVVLAVAAARNHNRRMVENVTEVPEAHELPPRTGYYVCRFHGGELSNGHIRCALPDGKTMGYAARGCCYWQREPGADD